MPFAGFFSNNPIVAWGIVLLTAFGLYKGKEQADRMIGARRQQRKMEAKARRVQTKLQEENNERLEKAERTRADFRATDADNFGGLSDAAIERITRGASRGGAGEG